MKTVAQFRAECREYMDLDTTDVSDNLIDGWLATAYHRIIASRAQHEFLQTTESRSVVAATQSYGFQATTPQRIVSIYLDNRQIQHTSHAYATETFGTASGTPIAWSLWANQIHLWPVPAASGTLKILGYKAEDLTWVGSAQTAIPLPDEYERAVFAWMMCEAFKHQNDTVMANNFAQDFAMQVEEANRLLSQRVMAQPIVLNGGMYPARAAVPDFSALRVMR